MVVAQTMPVMQPVHPASTTVSIQPQHYIQPQVYQNPGIPHAAYNHRPVHNPSAFAPHNDDIEGYPSAPQNYGIEGYPSAPTTF